MFNRFKGQKCGLLWLGTLHEVGGAVDILFPPHTNCWYKMQSWEWKDGAGWLGQLLLMAELLFLLSSLLSLAFKAMRCKDIQTHTCHWIGLSHLNYNRKRQNCFITFKLYLNYDKTTTFYFLHFFPPPPNNLITLSLF